MNFIALLLAEEVKFGVKLQGHRDQDFPYISDCLDDTGNGYLMQLFTVDVMFVACVLML